MTRRTHTARAPRLRTALLIPLLAACACLSTASAQTPPEGGRAVAQGMPSGARVLTLDSCIAHALAASPRMRMAENAIRTSELAASELRTTALPQVSASGSLSHAPIPPSFGYDAALSNGGQLAAQLIVHQSLYDAGVRNVKGRQLESDRARLLLERRQSGLDLSFAVRSAWIAALRARDEVALRAEGVTQLEEYHDFVGQLFAGGASPSTDLLKIALQRDAARIDLDRARETYATALLTLGEAALLDIDTTCVLQDTMLFSQHDASGVPDRVDTTAALDVRIADALVERSRFEEELSRRELYPNVYVVADAGYLNSGERLRSSDPDRWSAFGYSIGVGVEVPVLTWGASRLREEQRAVATDDARAQRELLARAINAERARVDVSLARTRARLDAIRSTVRDAGTHFLLVKSKYAAGTSPAIEVLQAQQMITDARMSELQARADLALLAARFERLVATQ